MTDNHQQPILEVKDLKKHYPIIKGFNRKLVGYTKAVDGVSFAVPTAQTLGLVGESGCGKSTTGHCIIRGIDPTAGQVIFHDRERGPIDVAQADPNMLRHVRLNMQMVFQDPSSSMNPRMTVFDIVSEPLVVNNVARGKDLQDRVAELLRVVGLLPEHMHRFPHAFSGGQRQRIAVARSWRSGRSSSSPTNRSPRSTSRSRRRRSTCSRICRSSLTCPTSSFRTT